MRAELVALPQHIPDAPALGGVANDSSSGHRRALLAWAPGQVLGWPARDFTPVSVAHQRHRNSRASRRHRLRWRLRVESINRPVRHRRRTLHDRPDHHDGRERRFRSFACGMIIRSGASHEVLSPSALAGRVALCRAAGLCTIPLRRFVWAARAVADSRSSLRPCGLSHCGACRGDARVMDEPV